MGNRLGNWRPKYERKCFIVVLNGAGTFDEKVNMVLCR